MLPPNILQPGRCLVLLRRLMALAATASFVCMTARAADTNAPPPMHFAVDRYEVLGNTLLPQTAVSKITSKHIGTNITFVEVAAAVKELQLEYHDRGYDTISVTVPQQKLTNGVFRLRVFEGKLAEIKVSGNRFFSSNNVMRALPGLTTNMYLNSKLMQPVLDMANQDKDRQIYPEIHPGPDPDTTSLVLRVKDQLPLHGKLEANNQSSPGTPDMRLAASAAYDNLWQLDHSIGLQYTFSEQDFKQGGSWNPYDQPQVANYSFFYCMPLSQVDSVAEDSIRSASDFGYNEATRKFVLPGPTGASELNFYASGSTIDSGLTYGPYMNIATGGSGSSNGTSSINRQLIQQDLTYNDAIGMRYTKPLQEFFGIHSHAQAGFDFKYFKQVAFATNDTIITEYLITENNTPTNRTSTIPSPVPASRHGISYLPLTFRWDGTRPDPAGLSGAGLSYSPNIWMSSSRSNLEEITGSTQSSGFWHVVTGYLSRDQPLPHEWKLALRLDGQWASEPLISNEEFGGGGIAGVRGYREGEVFGDTGWRATSELKLPPYRIGYVGGGTKRPLVVRSSFFMDYADTYLLDPGSRQSAIPLWGAGFAGAASLGNHFSGMLSFAWPFLSTPYTEAYQVRIAFSLTAQF